MRHQRHAGGQKLWPRGVNQNIALRAFEGQLVVGTWLFSILQFRLCNCGPEGDVPKCWRHGNIRLAALKIFQKSQLRCCLSSIRDGSVAFLPINTQAQVSPEVFKSHFVFFGECLAQLDEVFSTNRLLVLRPGAFVGSSSNWWGEIFLVGKGGLASNTVIILNSSLSWQSVVIPTHRIENLFPDHPSMPGDDVGVGVAEHMAHVQAPTSSRRGSVNGIDLLPSCLMVESISSVLIPKIIPFLLQTLQCSFVGCAGGTQRIRLN